MPAYFDTGFSVRVPMWHGEGQVLDDYPTDWNDAREKAGLLWEPELVPCYQARPVSDFPPADDGAPTFPEGTIVDPMSDTCAVQVPGAAQVQRSDTRQVIGKGLSDGFGLVYHSTMGEVMEALLGQTNVKFETAGSCRDGAQVWALAYLDEPIEVAGDNSPSYPFVVLLNSHDGSGACKVLPTTIRVVCWNTYQAASMEGERSGRQFVFRHSSQVLERIEDAKLALQGVREEATRWSAMAEGLLALRADDTAAGLFVERFIDVPVGQVVSDRVRNNVAEARSRFMGLYNGPTCEGHHGTALGLVDAAVEYLDHVRAFRNRDTYVGRTLLRPEPVKAQAVKLAREVCGAGASFN